MRRGLARALAIAVIGLAAALPAAAQTGFTPEGEAGQRVAEAALLDAIRPPDLAAMSRTLSSRMHVAGGPGQAAVRDTLVAWFGRWGFEPRVATYEVFLPWPTAVALALTAPEPMTFALGEEATSGYPWVNGYSAPGMAEAEAIYANFGLHEDYALLDSLGIDVEGRIVVARYGGSFRGIKARLAEAHGGSALILYSDPIDDGFVQGDVYPDGPFRPWSGVQRGSVMNGNGDPTTPAGPSTAGAPRVPPSESPNELPRIPVVPVSYQVAGEILTRLGGADLPRQDWQGGLAFRYHVGPGPARVRVEVADDRDGPADGMKAIHDVVGRIEGSHWPDEWVVVGAHIDAWGPGANDNVSGTVSVLAAARAIRALEGGGRPRRTIVFAGWDGEEWGLIGSTEWVEEHARELAGSAVAYINQDGVGGQRFGGAATPSLKPFLREATQAIPAAEEQSLYEVWAADADTVPALGDLGGGSDFAPFYNHLGIPSTNHGFSTPGGVYHSAFDTHLWMAEFGDPGFVHHAMTAELTAVMALRLANAEILPYDYAAFAREIAAHWEELRPAGDGEPLSAALAELERAGERLNAARATYLAGSPEEAASRRANRALRSVERELTREQGLEGRPWYRNLVFAADGRNGYATLALPSVAEAVRAESPDRVAAESADLAGRVLAATARVEAAVQALSGAGDVAPSANRE